MADKAREWTDKELEKMERHIAEIYQEAQNGIKEKWDGYMECAEKRVERYQDAVDKAVEDGDKDKIKAAKEALKKAERSITITDQYYQEMIDETTTRLANTNQIAIDYMNDSLPKIYSRNYNDEDPAAKKLGISYSIRNEATVKRLIVDGDIQLPYKKLDIPKDKRWNTKLLNSQVLQGILQGESMPQISKRILPVVDNNKNAAVRNARTMVTGAENRGKSDRFHALQDRGAVIKKVWIATPDGRTRDWHLSMDGQEVDLDEDFIDGNGNELSYPGDPDGEPETVYNCRCSMVSNIVGFRKANGEVVPIEDYDESEEMHDEQIEAEKERREQEKEKETIKYKSADNIFDINNNASETLGRIYDLHTQENELKRTSYKEIKESGMINPVYANYSNLSVETANEFTKTIAELSNEYDTQLQTIRTMTKNEALRKRKTLAFVTPNYSLSTAELVINPVYCKDYNKMVEKVSELSDKKWSVQVQEGKESQYVVTHEFAHTLINMVEPLNKKTNFVNADYEKVKSAREEITAIYGEYIANVGKLEKAFKDEELRIIMGEVTSTSRAIELKKEYESVKLSNYSMTNSDEFLAESFVNHRIGKNENEYAEKAVSVLDKYFRRQI